MNTTIAELYELFLRHPHVTTDSRNCPPDAVFFALKGERFDGNLYAEKALEAGCSFAVVDNPAYHTGGRTILVDDVLQTLQQLAAHHRKIVGIPLIAVTGTNGKTTTKELLAAVLSAGFRVLHTEGNLNNQIGVPLTLLRLNRTHEIAIVETGASRPGDIRELVEIACPDYGIITNVGCAHLEGFGAEENVLQTKGELYEYLRRTQGRIFIRKEDEALQSTAQGIEQITYGSNSRSFVSGQILSCNPFLVFQWKQQGEAYTVKTNLIGDYNLDNVLAAITAGRYFNIPPDRINQALEAYTPTNNRSQLKKTVANTLIIDAYNANPSSMKAALRNFAAMSESPKAVILGDMLELGETADALHSEIIDLVRRSRFGKVFLCGKHFTAAAGNDFPTFPTTEDLIETLRNHPLKGYHILIKGSHGMALERVTDYL
ncbi:UDP-N-acetylmuramoyl-tripeptide--D-alanyl-D- alanine ligase [Bacteroidales bacterium Barb4]|nr:UDP-N-acetylmuramoyl-tripeptide--D-alanyl-D- alanine ligase [Bacteroidales bacterium Barb4]